MRISAWLVRKPQRRMALGGLGGALDCDAGESLQRRFDERLGNLHVRGSPRPMIHQRRWVYPIDVLSTCTLREDDAGVTQVLEHGMGGPFGNARRARDLADG